MAFWRCPSNNGRSIAVNRINQLAEVFMPMQRLLAASTIVLSSLAFAADPPKPADNTDVKPPAPQQPNPQRPQQPQRGFGRLGFGQGFQRDPFVDALNALGDLALAPDFTITTEQKESIQSLR